MNSFFDSLVCIVPAKTVSQRLPNKNRKPFFRDLSLLDIKIRQLKQLMPAENILVVSENDDRADLSRCYGVQFLRLDPTIYDDNVSLRDFFEIVLPSILTLNLLVAYVTTPYLNQSAIGGMISQYRSLPPSYDSLVAVTRVQTKLFDHHLQPANFGFGFEYKGSQKVAPIFSWIRGVSILSTAVAKKNSLDLGLRPYLFEVNRIQAIDIDTQADWELATTVAHSPDGERLLGLAPARC
ncbi:MAG: hypothetical protein WAM82_21035 [Thermoanaerobaculia bacterium]